MTSIRHKPGVSNSILIFVLAALAATSLTACSDGGGRHELAVTDGNPRAVIGDYELGGAGQTAQLQGTLSVANGGCFHLDEGGGQQYLLVFPQGSETLIDGRPGIQVQGQQYFVGDEVAFGGGFRTLDDAERQSVADCQPDGEVFMVQSLTEN